MTYLLKFGSYTLPETFYVEKWPTSRSVPSQKLARADGARTIGGYLEGKTWSVKGGLVGGREILPTAPGFLRDQLDALRTALESGYQTFQAHDDRLYRLCQVSQFDEQYQETAFGHYAEISFEVVTGDPFAYEVATQTVTQAITATGQTASATAGGNASALPVIALTIGTSGALAATVTNQTNGDVCTLTGTVTSGQVYLLDSLNKTVTLQSSGADKLALFDGVFPRLNVGSNTVKIEYGSGATISSVTLTWQNRWF